MASISILPPQISTRVGEGSGARNSLGVKEDQGKHTSKSRRNYSK